MTIDHLGSTPAYLPQVENQRKAVHVGLGGQRRQISRVHPGSIRRAVSRYVTRHR